MMIVNTNCFGKFLLFINAKNYQITTQITRKILLASSFLFLFTTAFIPIASAQKAVILNFDDDWKGQFTYAVPILEKYGFKASFFVTCGCLTYHNSSFCNNAGGDSAMTWENITSLSKMGYDMQAHGMSHKDLTTLSDSGLEYEVGQTKQCLLEHGFNSTVFGPAYANGEGNSTITNTISKYYDMARVGYGPLVYFNSTDRYSLPLLTDYQAEATFRDNSEKILDIFIQAISNQSQYNGNGTITAIPILV